MCSIDRSAVGRHGPPAPRVGPLGALLCLTAVMCFLAEEPGSLAEEPRRLAEEPRRLAEEPRDQGIDFARDVRPILANRCFRCHGPDDSTREAGLRLDLRDESIRELASGARAIVPGRPWESALVARITSTDPDAVMPPPETKARLTDAEIRILGEWIAAGAEERPHWAFIAPVRPPLPPGETAVNPIDRFVHARLRAEGLVPAPPADPATLCRRVHLDLVGLPPTPAEVEAFVAECAPGAGTAAETVTYERLVDRLLASPRYGERWARRWLDLARYADTNGYEKDRERTIWPWRDWVIRALNDDMPFDRFTVRQLAGDMLPGASADDIVATGFHRNTMINEEGGIDPLEFRWLAMVDRVGTTGATWLGLSTACAQCHSHKFDPLTHRDYYGLFALLNNADEPEWPLTDPQRAADRAVARERIEAAWGELPARWPPPSGDSAAAAVATLASRFDAWNRTESARAVDWRIVPPTALASTTPHLTLRPDGSILAGGDVAKSDVYRITLPPQASAVRALRLEVLPDESLPARGPGLTWYEGPKGDFFLSEIECSSGGRRLPVAAASASFAGKAAFSGAAGTAAAAVDGDMSSGWSTNGEQGRPHAAVFVFATPLPPGEPLEVVLRFERHFACGLGCFRLSVTDRADAEARGHTAAEEAALARPPDGRSLEERERIFRRFLGSSPELAEPVAAIRRLEEDQFRGTTTLVLRERPSAHPRPTFRHHRGEYLQPREPVAPAVPAFLPPLPVDRPADRLALAEWLVSPRHPLTARVTVNRQWQAFFGRGLVATLEDFGVQGSPPSHPHLLDWLAVTFVEDLGWSLKSLHRLIVTSATYRQAARPAPELVARDPDNVLLARGPRARLEAEVIRDSLLAAAGMLSTRMHGPGVRPPQPSGITEVAYGAPTWTPSEGEDRHRRSIYTYQKRTAPFAFTTTFDGPTGESCLARRDISTSPLQALTLLNDPMFVEVAQALGRLAAEAGPDDDARFSLLARRLFSRDLDGAERALLGDYLAAQRRRIAAGEIDPAAVTTADGTGGGERAVWTLVARVLMNTDEVVVKR
jgi:hypothetical protein